jgi:hypothetical protein
MKLAYKKENLASTKKKLASEKRITEQIKKQEKQSR